MLKKQRNAIYLEISNAGINPAYFEIKETDSKSSLTTLINVRDSRMTFAVSENKQDFDKYSTSFIYPQSGFPQSSYVSQASFNSVLRAFKEWLLKYAKDFIEDEVEGIDLWSPVEAFKSITGTSGTSSEDDAKFTPQEKEHVRQSTQRFRQLIIQNFKPTKEQQQHIDSQLDYLVNAVDRLSRRDWRGVALSTIISIGINLTVDTAKGDYLLKLFMEAFNQVIKALPHMT